LWWGKPGKKRNSKFGGQAEFKTQRPKQIKGEKTTSTPRKAWQTTRKRGVRMTRKGKIRHHSNTANLGGEKRGGDQGWPGSNTERSEEKRNQSNPFRKKNTKKKRKNQITKKRGRR